MEIKELNISGVFEIILDPLIDKRGFFMRTYDEAIFKKHGLVTNWVQENHSLSSSIGTIRGLHFQLSPFSETKLVRCVKGKIWDVFVDLRKDSQTFGKSESIYLSDEEYKLLYLPKGIAHGFCILSDSSEILYKHDECFNSKAYSGIKYNDPDLNIDWPTSTPIVSEKDKNLQSFKEFINNYEGL